MSVKHILKSLAFFNTLNNEQIEQLCSISCVVSYDEEYLLHYEKQETQQLLFLTQGLAKSYKIDKHENEIFLYYIYKNNMLSEISNIQDDTISSFSNIQFLEKSQILSIDYPAFKEQFLNKNLLCMEFANEVIQHANKMQNLINREFIFDSVAKVSMMLSSDLEMFNKLKRHDIALILHIQPATLSRVLNRLKRNAIIDIIHGKVTVLNMNKLQSIYQE
ncbi:MAG: Crp/Fnr family transcriptional regulator [Campylobacterota bacterium]|nr:Crp/Fnr family transcriptional regulator [Campylobacterota bacterium]